MGAGPPFPFGLPDAREPPGTPRSAQNSGAPRPGSRVRSRPGPLRTRQAWPSPRTKGRLRGQAPRAQPAKERLLVELLRAGGHSIKELEDIFGLTRSTIYRASARARGGDRSRPLGRPRGRGGGLRPRPHPHARPAGGSPCVSGVVDGGIGLSTFLQTTAHAGPTVWCHGGPPASRAGPCLASLGTPGPSGKPLTPPCSPRPSAGHASRRWAVGRVPLDPSKNGGRPA